jgi:hypothetical protein
MRLGRCSCLCLSENYDAVRCLNLRLELRSCAMTYLKKMLELERTQRGADAFGFRVRARESHQP